MNKREIGKVELFCKQNMGRVPAHDYSHAHRTREWARRLCIREGISCTHEIEIAALLHDIGLGLGEREFHGEEGAVLAEKFLSSETSLSKQTINNITYAIRWHNKKFQAPRKTKLLEIVTDADTLDLLGAVGIWRSLMTITKVEDDPKDIAMKLRKQGSYDDEHLRERLENTHSLIDQITFQISSYDTLFTTGAKEFGAPMVSFLKNFRYMLWNELGVDNMSKKEYAK